MSGIDGGINPLAALQLRCGSCGAPYTKSAQNELLTCSYCGTTQRVADARQFLDHFMAQVTAFVRQAVPAGMDVSRTDSLDPVARLAAFNMGIRPRLSTESEQYRFSCFNLLSNPLTVLPFSPNPVITARVEPMAISIFAAKVQSVAGLAVDDGSKALIQRAGGLASAYQSLLVAAGLSTGSQPERFHLIAQNYETARKAIEGTGHWRPVATRLGALVAEVRAVDLLLSGEKLREARELLGSAGRGLSEAREQLVAMPEIGYLTTAVDQELAGVRTLGSQITISENSATVLPHPLTYGQRLSQLLDWLASSAPADWAPAFRSSRLREEVFRRAADLRSAQAGAGSVRVVGVGSGTLVPFWAVQLPYTFETGVAWTKRGKEVSEVILVAATFPSDPNSFHGDGCARVLTDVFSVGNRGLGGGYLDRVRGREQRISESGAVLPTIQNATPGSIGGQQAIPPLATEAEALRLVEAYIDRVKSANPKASSQLRASSPRIIDLVYVPCVLHATPPVPWLGATSPASVGNIQTLLGFVN